MKQTQCTNLQYIHLHIFTILSCSSVKYFILSQFPCSQVAMVCQFYCHALVYVSAVLFLLHSNNQLLVLLSQWVLIIFASLFYHNYTQNMLIPSHINQHYITIMSQSLVTEVDSPVPRAPKTKQTHFLNLLEAMAWVLVCYDDILFLKFCPVK